MENPKNSPEIPDEKIPERKKIDDPKEKPAQKDPEPKPNAPLKLINE